MNEKRDWSYSLQMLVCYVSVFLFWRAFPSRVGFVAAGLLTCGFLIAGMIRAAKRGYFINRVDLSAHALVIIDLVLESFAFEFLSFFQPHTVVEQFHNNTNFFGCSLAFSLIIGIHRGLLLRRDLRTKLHENLVTTEVQT